MRHAAAFGAVAACNGVLAACGAAWGAAQLSRAAGADGGALLIAGWTGALALAATLGVGLIAGLFARRWPRGATAGLVVGNAAVLLLLVLDLRAYALLGLHLHSPVTLDALSNPNAGRELALGAATLGAIAAVAALLALSQWGLVRLARAVPARAATGLAVAGAAASALTLFTVAGRGAQAAEPVLDALPAWELLARGAPWTPAVQTLRWPLRQGPLPALERRPDIVFVAVESLRSDAVTDAPMTRLAALADRDGCVSSVRHHSGGHTTEYGMFSLLYGLESHRYGPLGAERRRSLPLDLLRASGYRLVGRSASGLRDWNDAAFIVDQLDDYEELVTEGSWEGDEQVVRWAEALAATPSAEPRFVLLFLNATHHNYLYPQEFERHVPVIEPGYDHFLGDDELASHRDAIRNRTLNAALYVDSLVGRIDRAFSPGGEAALLVTGDHGEELWEHGLLGHGAPRFEEERIRVPLALCLPGARGGRVERSSHVDLWPTILDHLGVLDAVPPATWSDGGSLLRPPAPALHVIGGTTFPWGNPTGCVIDGAHKVWVKLGRAPGPHLVATRVTDLDDRPVVGWDPHPSIERAVAHMERFVGLRWAEGDGR